MPQWTIVQHDAVVPAGITERFCEWLVWVLAEAAAGRVVVGKPIDLTLPKPSGEPYSDTTFHTQVTTVLHRADMVQKYPDLRLFRIRYLNKQTTLYLTKLPKRRTEAAADTK